MDESSNQPLMTVLVVALFSLAIIQGVQVFNRSSSSVLGAKTTAPVCNCICPKSGN